MYASWGMNLRARRYRLAKGERCEVCLRVWEHSHEGAVVMSSSGVVGSRFIEALSGGECLEFLKRLFLCWCEMTDMASQAMLSLGGFGRWGAMLLIGRSILSHYVRLTAFNYGDMLLRLQEGSVQE